MKTISLDFSGYWREINKEWIPEESGVYCVYACTYNRDHQNLSIRELLYVGESGNVNERISNHEKTSDWKRRLRVGEVLCFSMACVGAKDRNQAEAAVINHHKPSCNTEYKYSFPYDTTVIYTSGRNYLLDTRFVVG